MAKKTAWRSEETRRRFDEVRQQAKDYVAYQKARDLEERNFKRGFDAAFRARNKDGRLVLGSEERKRSQSG